MISGGKPALTVSDIDRSVRFYVETLGFKLTSRIGNDWAEVDAGGGFVLGLHHGGERGPKPGTPGSVALYFEVNQPIAEVVEVLANRGVTFEGPVKANGPVKIALFVDPDGNVLRLVEGK